MPSHSAACRTLKSRSGRRSFARKRGDTVGTNPASHLPTPRLPFGTRGVAGSNPVAPTNPRPGFPWVCAGRPADLHMSAQGVRAPSPVLPGHAHRAWLVPGCDRGGFIEEEHPVGAVAATGQRPEGRPAIQPAVDAPAAVAAEHAGASAAMRPAIGPDDLPGPAGAGLHAAASMASRARLASGPPRYSPVVPSLRTTRWHGTTSGSGLCEQALAAARTADGFPAALATAA